MNIRPPTRADAIGGGAVEGPPGTRSFTIVEVMLAIAIFSMVITAIYSSWSAILRASKAGADAATELQRSRIAARTLEDALVSAVMFAGNYRLYTFEADTMEDFAALSFVSRLPPSFPGSGFFGDQVVRRVTFMVEQADDGVNQLVLRQIPLLQTNVAPEDEFGIVLAREVSLFALEFWDARANEWTEQWRQTNQLPKMVRFALAFGQTASTGKPAEVTVRVVSVPSTTVLAEWQMPRLGPGGPGGPGGAVPPGGAGGRGGARGTGGPPGQPGGPDGQERPRGLDNFQTEHPFPGWRRFDQGGRGGGFDRSFRPGGRR